MGWFGKRRDSSQWPSAVAAIDELYANAATVEGSGAFTVNGEYYSVQIKREFRSTRDAEAWVARIESTPSVTIRYDPADPSNNIVDEAAF